MTSRQWRNHSRTCSVHQRLNNPLLRWKPFTASTACRRHPCLKWRACPAICVQQCSAAIRRCHSIQAKINDLRLASLSPAASPTRQHQEPVLDAPDAAAPPLVQPETRGALLPFIQQCHIRCCPCFPAAICLCFLWAVIHLCRCPQVASNPYRGTIGRCSRAAHAVHPILWAAAGECARIPAAQPSAPRLEIVGGVQPAAEAAALQAHRGASQLSSLQNTPR